MPLSFEVHCTSQGASIECHSKIKGGGFISTKEKLLKCVNKLVAVLEGKNDSKRKTSDSRQVLNHEGRKDEKK